MSALSIQASWSAATQSDAVTRAMAHDIFKQLIEINTTDSIGSTTEAAQAMAQRLLDAGFPKADVVVLGPNDRKGNMVARYRGKAGSKLRPLLIIGHLDVVEARRDDWTTDPFKFVEQDGYYYGRGTQDMKEDDAIAGHRFHPHAEGRIRSGPRHHPGAHRGRRGGQVERRRLAAAKSPRSDRRGIRAQSGLGRRQHGSRQAAGGGIRGHREALCGFPGARHQSRRPQLAAEAGQCDLSRGGRARRVGEVAVSVRAECRDARVFRPNGQDRDRTERG